MWRDDDDRIMNILDCIEGRKSKFFPVACPICGKKEGHIYFYRNEMNEALGSMWTWCSACCYSAHTRYRIPKWWKNLDTLNAKRFTSFPDYLEKNKICIDKWVNELMNLKQ